MPILNEKADPLKRASDAAGKAFQPRFLQAVDKALELLPSHRPQSIVEWRRLFPQTTEVRRPRRPWGWFGAAAASLLVAALLLANQRGWWVTSESGQLADREQMTEQTSGARGDDRAEASRRAKAEANRVNQQKREEQRQLELALRREQQEAARRQQARAAEAKRVEREVAELLARAKRQRQQGHLTLPSGDNAYKSYQQVLALVPANREAKAGMDGIADDYQRLAAARRQDGELQKSLNLIRAGRRVAPKHSGLKALQDEVNAELAANREAKQPPQSSESVWKGVTLIKQRAEKVDDVVPPTQ